MSTDIPPSGGNNSDHLEEQAMEIEAMQAVFMDDFNCGILLRFWFCSNIKRSRDIQNQTCSRVRRWELRLVLDILYYLVGISMVIRYTPMYPDDVPNICFVDAVNIPEDDIISLTQMIYVLSVYSFWLFLGQSTRFSWHGHGV